MAHQAQRHRKGGRLTLAVNSSDLHFKVFPVLLLVPCNKEAGEERFRMCKLCVHSSRNWWALIILTPGLCSVEGAHGDGGDTATEDLIRGSQQ